MVPCCAFGGITILKTSLSPTGSMNALTLLLIAIAAKSLAWAITLLGSISQPASRPHVDEQQSPLFMLPSSHTSAPALMPSPHTVLQTLGEEPLQVQPVSTWHVALQPSPLT